MSIRITTLIEDSLPENSILEKEHGLSFFVEVEGSSPTNILFDTGQSRKFINNARRLNIDLAKTKKIIVSHGHYDHSGGLKDFIEEYGSNFELLLGDGFFNEKYAQTEGGWKFLGNNFTKKYLKEKSVPTRILKKDLTEISPGVYVMTNFPRKTDFEEVQEKFFIKKASKYRQDLFNDELVLVLETKAGLVVLLGCSHPGLVNILEAIQERLKQPLYCILGGSHLVGAPLERLDKTIDYLKDLKFSLLGLSHCTGEPVTGRLAETEKEFFMNSTGTRFEFAL